MKNKLHIAFLLSAVLVVSPVFALEYSSIEQAAENGRIGADYRDKLQKDEAETRKIALKIYEVESAYETYDTYKSNPSREDDFTMQSVKDYAMKKTILGNELKKKSYQVEKNANIIAAYLLEISYVKSMLGVDLKQKELELAHAALDAKRIEFSQGRILKQDIVAAEAALESSSAELNSAKSDAEEAYNKLQAHLGVEYNLKGNIGLERRKIAPETYYLRYSSARIECAQYDIKNKINILDIDHYENSHKSLSKEEERDLKRLRLECEENKLKLKAENEKLTEEILKAYDEFYESVDSFDVALAAEKMFDKKMGVYRQLLELGKISKIQFLSLEVQAIKTKSNRILAAMNSKIISKKLLYAASAGPSYDYDYENEGKENDEREDK